MSTHNAFEPFARWMPDMGRELLHWRRSYPDRRYFRAGLEFDRYVATFKFGYDTFQANQQNHATELSTGLCHQYKDGVRACDRIDWAEAEMIVQATWARMREADRARAVVML
jgi:hypothetical protein